MAKKMQVSFIVNAIVPTSKDCPLGGVNVHGEEPIPAANSLNEAWNGANADTK